MNTWYDIVPVVSLVVAFLSLYIGSRSIKRSRETAKLVANISALVNASQKLGLTLVYRSRNSAFEQFWTKHLRDEQGDVIILGTSLLGLMTGCSDINTIIKKRPQKYFFVLVHPDYATHIETQENRKTMRQDIINALHNLTTWGVPDENIRLLKAHSRNFVIITPTKILINPTVYETDAFRYCCFECENRNLDDIYHQYYEHHYKMIWNSKMVEKYNAASFRTPDDGATS